MPKKFGTNTKSQEARERKEAQKEQLKSKVAKEEEDSKWVENDEHVVRKLQRKEEREAKRLETIKKKQEIKRLHDEEMNSLEGAKTKDQNPNPNKLTQAQIAAARARLEAERASLMRKKEKEVEKTEHLAENPNILPPDEISARTVEDAIKVLSINDDLLDKHPEKRFKSAYLAYVEKMMPILKEENPGMRHSQLNDKIYKMFQNAPENPRNQTHSKYNEK
ncbi:unnamed protein product [Hymenolepis diminuta]|uniref:Coiled-coil domain-containing protein n=1 Tax=Hymenolepis diminuta TaxID=6216 RepID=A0A0R3SDL9_HYMDI|nr:unnamed protein product [Hymenolepis diminuta]